jgi:hypothetical protein
MTRHSVAIVLLFEIAPALFGQAVSGPVLGYVWDPQVRSVRPLLGIPGAASAGAPLPLGDGLASATVASGHNFAVVLTQTGEAAVANLQMGAALRPLVGLRTGASRVELSPNGSSAAFYFPGERLVQVVSGLPDSPGAAQDFSLAPLRGDLQALAVADDGRVLLCAESGVNGGEPAAAVLTPAGDVNRIALPEAVTAIAFLRGTRDVLIASASEMVLVRDAAVGTPTPVSIAGLTVGAVAFRDDGNGAIVADTANGAVALVDFDSRIPAQVLNCNCTIGEIAPLKGGTAYRMDGYSNAPLHVLDLSGRPRFVNVPPRVESSQ